MSKEQQTRKTCDYCGIPSKKRYCSHEHQLRALYLRSGLRYPKKMPKTLDELDVQYMRRYKDGEFPEVIQHSDVMSRTMKVVRAHKKDWFKNKSTETDKPKMVTGYKITEPVEKPITKRKYVKSGLYSKKKTTASVKPVKPVKSDKPVKLSEKVTVPKPQQTDVYCIPLEEIDVETIRTDDKICLRKKSGATYVGFVVDYGLTFFRRRPYIDMRFNNNDVQRHIINDGDKLFKMFSVQHR